APRATPRSDAGYSRGMSSTRPGLVRRNHQRLTGPDLRVLQTVRGNELANARVVLLRDAPQRVTFAHLVMLARRRRGRGCSRDDHDGRPLLGLNAREAHVLLGEHGDVEVRRVVLFRGFDDT